LEDITNGLASDNTMAFLAVDPATSVDPPPDTPPEIDSAPMVQAEKLYRRFLDETDSDGVPEDNAATVQADLAPQQGEPRVEEPARGPCVEEPAPEPSPSLVMDLRRQLWQEHQTDGVTQRAARAVGPPPPGAPLGPPV
jgi:hypothetical protein